MQSFLIQLRRQAIIIYGLLCHNRPFSDNNDKIVHYLYTQTRIRHDDDDDDDENSTETTGKMQ